MDLKVELAVRERQLCYRVGDGEFAVLDGGRRWLRRLSFKDSKLGMRRIVGDNAHPGSWAAFIDLMNEIPGGD